MNEKPSRPLGAGHAFRLVTISAVAAALCALLTPGEAFAWGPATHIALGEAVLSSLHLLPAGLAALLRARIVCATFVVTEAKTSAR